jgi:hypothetical protein
VQQALLARSLLASACSRDLQQLIIEEPIHSSAADVIITAVRQLPGLHHLQLLDGILHEEDAPSQPADLQQLEEAVLPMLPAFQGTWTLLASLPSLRTLGLQSIVLGAAEAGSQAEAAALPAVAASLEQLHGGDQARGLVLNVNVDQAQQAGWHPACTAAADSAWAAC